MSSNDQWLVTPENIQWTMNWSKYPNTQDKPDEIIFDEALALAALLINDVVFLNSRWWSEQLPEDVRNGIVACVNCNDIFAWACADAEELPYDEIETLYKMWRADSAWGPAKWCCLQRKEKPQKPVEEAMRKDGSWDDAMENLGKNVTDVAIAAAMGLPHPDVPKPESLFNRFKRFLISSWG